jgi:hypothetical protein
MVGELIVLMLPMAGKTDYAERAGLDVIQVASSPAR